MMEIFLSSLSQGLVWSIMALGVYVTFRILDIADLSAEGVFPLGGAVAASLIATGTAPLTASLVACVAGSLAGLVAGLLHTQLKIPSLLTGILILTGIYSINLKIMGNKSNIALLGKKTVYSTVQQAYQLDKVTAIIAVLLIVLVIVIVLLWLFLKTEIGLALRATGANERMSEANGISTKWMKVLGYMIGNGLIALAGALVAQKDGFADVGMGIGTIVIGLASVIMAEVLLHSRKLAVQLTAIVAGSFVYRLLIDIILNQKIIEIQANDLRLFSALLLTIVLSLPLIQSKWRSYQRRQQLKKEGTV